MTRLLLLTTILGAAHAATLTAADCTAARLGAAIPAKLIGEPVSGVTIAAPQWHAGNPAYCEITGAIAPIDTSATARPIHFAVALPADWQGVAAQMGGGGMNGTVVQVAGGGMGGGPSLLSQGLATYGSDSGHSSAEDQWALNDEAIKNLGYMQMKKTHDAAMVLIQRAYEAKPRYNYYIGASQGGREGLTVAQRYPADYDGVSAGVPIVNFTGLMFAPTWIQERQMNQAAYVSATKAKAIAAAILRQCDKLDGLVDGVINNYVACRAIFSAPGNPWTQILCPNDTDPNPADTSAQACITKAQSATLKFIFSRYDYATPMANGNRSFGMWAPTVDLVGGMGGPPPGMKMPAGPGGPPPGMGPMPRGMVMGGLLNSTRYRGQQGTPADAPTFSSIGSLGLTGFVMRNLAANPLDYSEGKTNAARRIQVAQWLDSTNPDLSAFAARGGKLIVAIGTSDTTASSGSQLDYYQAVLDKMGRAKLDSFARLYVLPQTGHGLTGASFTIDGNGKTIPAKPIPSDFDRVAALRAWVEHGIAPGKSVIATGATGTRPLCSYPEYPRYDGGDVDKAESYKCSQ